MKILAFDTSSEACTVALWQDDVARHEQIRSSHQIAPMQQAKLILPIIDSLLDQAGLTLKDLDAVAFGCGPGSFTGMRIASSVVQGFGLAVPNLPIIRLSSLAILAQTAFINYGRTKLLVAVDARMNQVYWANYQVDEVGVVEPVSNEILCFPHEINVPPKTDGDWYGIGDAWQKYQSAFINQLNFTPDIHENAIYPEAEVMITLTKRQLENRQQVAVSQALPTYLR